MSTKSQTKVAVKSKAKVALAPPRDHKVIYLNDHITAIDFVIETLTEIFDHDADTAEYLTQKIHEDGSAVVAVLPFEIAEHKGVEVTILARSNGFPLQVKIEPED